MDYALQNKRAVKGDIRGCHEPKCRTPELSASRVSQHISKFPRHVSHYCRSSSAKEYLKGISGIADVHRLYTDECTVASEAPVSEWVYGRIFNGEFNLAFHQPKSDTCKKCDMFAVQKGLPYLLIEIKLKKTGTCTFTVQRKLELN